MTWLQSPRSKYSAVAVGSAVLGFLIAWPVFATGQDKKDPPADPAAKHAVPADKTGDANKELADQIRQLNAKVARLEAALKQDPKATPSGVPDKGGMAGMQDKTGGNPPGGRVSAKYQNCLQCHQKRPSGPLPPSHLEVAEGSDKGAKQDDKTGTGGTGMGTKDGDEMMEMMKMMEMMQMKMKKMMGGMGGGGMDGMAMGGKGMGMMEEKKAAGMGMMAEKKGMGGMGGDKAGMGGMSGGMADMEMMETMGMMGMAPKSAGGMGGMKSMGKMQMQAALPGFPGASHIYHIGATDFFLNHPEHITLSPKQESDLLRLKEKAVLTKTSAQRKIDEAEQELWILTSSDEPDAAKIEAKIQEIEKLRGAQRMAIIRAVGDAAKLLTDEQRKVLIGQGPPATAEPPHVHPKTP